MVFWEWFGDELNVKSNSWTQIFWMAQVTLFKYLIISNNYFTMNGFTDKDAILVIFCANILSYSWQKFQPCQTSCSVFPPEIAYLVHKSYVFESGQNFRIFASPTKGMDTFLFEMSMKWIFTFKNFRNVYWHGKTHSDWFLKKRTKQKSVK